MSRSLNAATTAVIGNTDLQFFHLLTFNFASPFRLTDHAHDITYDFGAGPETFLSSGRLASSSNIDETLELNNPTINITLTGANQADISLALTENFNNRQVIIRRGFFDSSGQTTDFNIIADPFILFDGRVDSFSITDDPSSGSSTISWKIASHWADWERIQGRRCNNQDAQSIIDPITGSPLFPNEDGFAHCYDQIGNRTWGRILSRN